MAQLHELALQYQQALDGLRGDSLSDAANAASLPLRRAIKAAMIPPLDGAVNYSALESIILRTTLATSIVAYFERISWETVTLPMQDSKIYTHEGFSKEFGPLW